MAQHTNNVVHYEADSRQISFLFPPMQAGWITGQRSLGPWLSNVPASSVKFIAVTPGYSSSRYEAQDSIGIQARIMEPFLKEFWPREQEARNLAKHFGPDVFRMMPYRGVMDRLRQGRPLPEIRLGLSEVSDDINRDVVSQCYQRCHR